MKLSSIHIDGFGRLVDKEFLLKPGLNVFFGPNEAGKSTLQQAILALLYGFYKGNRRRSADDELLDQFRPWLGSSYGGYLDYRVDGGRAYRAIRSYEGELQTSIVEADTGRDISAEFEQGRLGRLDFAQKHLGMSREVFINTCFVQQSDLHKLEPAAQTITETIMNLADTGTRERTIVRAQEILESALKEQVGSDRAFTKPLPTARAKLAALTVEKATIDKKRQELDADYESRRNTKSDLDRSAQELDKARFLLARQKGRVVLAKIEKAENLLGEERDLESRIDQAGASSGFPIESRDAVTRLCLKRATLTEQEGRLAQTVDATASQVVEWQRELNTLLEEARRLEPARRISPDQEAAIAEKGPQRSDLTNEIQAKEQKLADLDRSIAGRQYVRGLAQNQKTLVETGPERIHDLHLRWELASQQLRDASARAADAKSIWQQQGMAPDEFTRLCKQVEGLNPTAIAELKAAQATEQARLTQPSASGNQMMWLIIGAGLGVAGLILVALGLFTHVLVSIIGIMVIFGDILLCGLAAMYLRNAGSNPGAPVSDRFEDIAPQIAQRGFTSIAQVETAYLSYLRAQPLHEKWITADNALAERRDQVENREAELRAILGLSAQANLSSELLSAAERNVRQILEELGELDKLERERSTFVSGLQSRRVALTDLEGEIAKILAAAGVNGPDLPANIGLFSRYCQDHRRLEQVDARVRELQAKIDGKLDLEQQFRSAQAERQGAERELQRLLRQAGITTDDLDKAIAEFQEQLQRAELAGTYQTRIASLARERNALLGSQTLQQLRAQEAELAQEGNALLAAHPDFVDLMCADTEQMLQARVDEIKDRLAEDRNRLTAVESRIAGAMADQRSLAEVEEDIAGVQALIERLTEHGNALELALQHLLAAADEHHRDFLPRLNAILGQSLDAVTNGHYKQVQVDHANLEVRVQVPEIARPVTPEILSRGTQEQIYLLLRLALTELLSEGRERLPLILDDPLVNYDQDRLRAGLDFLARLAEQAQILLFTRDATTVEWFKSKHDNAQQHCLHFL